MKRILILFLILCPVALLAQPTSGDGTLGNPYTGIVSTPWTLSGDTYCGDLVVSNGVFTISAGSILRFGSGSNLTISGTAVLSAIGNSSQYITFTSSGTSWGHLEVSTTATSNSNLTYCIIEKGTNPGGYGGGVHINTNRLVVSNCVFQNNSAGWGGGVFLDVSSVSSISNCLFRGNIVTQSGGGLYAYSQTTGTITNCLFYNNDGYFGGGGLFLGDDVRSLKIINCTISNNIAGNGTNVYLAINTNSNKPSFTNCIIWGNDNSIYYYSQQPAVSDFINCAIQNPVAGSTTNCITLNSSNADAAGPNFINPAGGDYSILFVSPCRDAGTTPSPAVPNDFIGKPRVGPYDIGAYEVQYNRWTGTINGDWFTPGNWSANDVPNKDSYAVIGPSTHDPIITLFNTLTLNSLSIESSSTLTVNGRTLNSTNIKNSGTLRVSTSATLNVSSFVTDGTFIVEPTGMATVTALTNNGTINLNSDYVAMFSLILSTYSGTGTVNSELYFSGGINSGGYSWHYLAVTQSMSKSVLTNLIADQANVNLLLYDDSKINAAPTPHNVNQGWQWHDGYLGTAPFSTLDEKRGYSFYRKTTDASTATLVSTSLLSDLGLVNLQYSGSGTNESLYGWNLLGNSLTCGLDWNYVTTSGRNAVYFTNNDEQRAFVNGVGVNGGSNLVPPLQGFLVKATATGQSVNFTDPLVKVHSPIQYYKRSVEADPSKGGSGTIPLIRLEIQQGVIKDETVIRFDDKATLQFDDAFDASKWLSAAAIPQLYSFSADEIYSINAIPFPSPITNIPLAVIIPADGTFTINKTLIDGIDNYKVILKDLQQNLAINLRDVDIYTFTASKGTIKDRFVLSIDNSTTGINDIINTVKDFNLYPFNGMLNIVPLNDDWNGKQSILNVYDLTGRIVLNKSNIEWNKGDLQQISFKQPKGIYIVEIKTENKRFVGKINIIY
jgi:hypothetical protein